MKKITTLYRKDPNDLSRVINEVDPANEWVFKEPHAVKATRKYDVTACAVINGELYKRYDVKKGRPVPVNAIPCQDPDPITGHWPHWVRCERNNPADAYHFEGFEDFDGIPTDGTYELCGPKVQGNPEKFNRHTLCAHGAHDLKINTRHVDFDVLHDFLATHDIEGIVFNHVDGRMCKLRKSDFGIKR